MNKEQLAARLLTTFLGELEQQIRAMNADLLVLEVTPTDREGLQSLFRVAHTLKGASRAVGLLPIEQVCHLLEGSLAQARDGSITLGKEDFALLFAAADALGDAGQRLRAGESVEGASLTSVLQRLRALGKPTAPRSAEDATVLRTPAPPDRPTRGEQAGDQVRVEAEKLNAVLSASGQLQVVGSRLDSRPGALAELHGLADRCASDWARADNRVRLVLERAEAPAALVQAVTGMREGIRRLARDTKRLAAEAGEDARVLTQATTEMAVQVRQLRLRPFSEACEALPRVVRDVATAAGKEVELSLIGGDVQVDRAVLDGLRESLTQLARNAVDHGIEAPDIRRKTGKPLRGSVRVSAALVGDRLRVTLADDGAGLDLPAVRAQLERRGLPIPPDERELVRSLFEGGFTTRMVSTAISGRGVGLDIVRAAVDRMLGTVEVTREPGGGTTFTIECPPTLATIRVLLVLTGSQLLAIPTASVERLVRIQPAQIRHAEGREVIVTEDSPVPVVSLAQLLPPLHGRSTAGPFPAVILRAGGRRLAVTVDELLAEQEIVLRPLKPGRRPLALVSGAAILGVGRVALVLNPGAVVATGLAPGVQTGPALAVEPPVGPARRRIVVVEDSITTRTLMQSIFESAGYDVTTAVDGADGWRVLQEVGSDLVVSDIEMPRMDGFALCAAIRGSQRFKQLPVVLVTALETAEHRARGLEVGADAYLGKSSFDQTNLLDAVRQLVG